MREREGGSLDESHFVPGIDSCALISSHSDCVERQLRTRNVCSRRVSAQLSSAQLQPGSSSGLGCGYGYGITCYLSEITGYRSNNNCVVIAMFVYCLFSVVFSTLLFPLSIPLSFHFAIYGL